MKKMKIEKEKQNEIKWNTSITVNICDSRLHANNFGCYRFESSRVTYTIR